MLLHPTHNVIQLSESNIGECCGFLYCFKFFLEMIMAFQGKTSKFTIMLVWTLTTLASLGFESTSFEFSFMDSDHSDEWSPEKYDCRCLTFWQVIVCSQLFSYILFQFGYLIVVHCIWSWSAKQQSYLTWFEIQELLFTSRLLSLIAKKMLH